MILARPADYVGRVVGITAKDAPKPQQSRIVATEVAPDPRTGQPVVWYWAKYA